MLLGIWLSSGTLAPFAITLEDKMMIKVDAPCTYLYNYDHALNSTTFKMLDGAPRAQWDYSFVLRRILFPLIAYPFMKLFSYEIGGVIAGALLNILAFFIFINFVKKKYSIVAANISMWLLALYPGIMYWAGLPYMYTCIVPFTLLATILLFKINESDDLKKNLLYFLLLGVLFTGYDLIVFFLPATIFILFKRRKFKEVPLALFFLTLPSIIIIFILYYFYQVEIINDNTNAYPIIINSYLAIFKNLTNPGWFYDWFKYVFFEKRFFSIFVHVFFKSNFYILPLLFIITYGFARFKYSFKLNTIETSILLATLLLFLFNNLAPKYIYFFQMRGDKIPRFYQPVFVAYVLYIARFFHTVNMSSLIRKSFICLFVFALTFNAVIILGPITKNRIGEKVYLDFYKHADNKEMIKNLNKYGRRPLGICN